MISNNIMSTTLAESNSNNNYGHTAITPDTTSIILAHQELRATSPASQQMNKLKSSTLSLSAPVNSSRPLPVAGSTVAPPMTMLSPFMGDFKGPVENLSLSSYMELITLVNSRIILLCIELFTLSLSLSPSVSLFLSAATRWWTELCLRLHL